MSGASGRLWLTGDGRGRIELQSDAGDVADRLGRARRSRVYDASSNTVYRADLPAQHGRAAADTRTPPTLARDRRAS